MAAAPPEKTTSATASVPTASPRTRSAAPRTGAPRTMPAPVHRAPLPSTDGPSPAAAEVAIAFANAYINWNASTVTADLRALAAQSVGQARSAMELAAGQTANDYELHQGGIANSGEIEAVGPLSGHNDQWVIVTREQTTATASSAYEGLRPAWHVTVATVIQLPSGRWVVSGWQPET